MGAKSPRTPPCTPGKRTRRSRSTPKSEKTEVRRAPPGKAAVEVAVDTFERMATRHLFALHDVSEAKSALEAAAQEEREASSAFASAFFLASGATAAADAASGSPVTRRVACVLRDAEACTQKQKRAAERVADATKKREEAELALRRAEAASRLAGDAFDPVAAARDAAASVSRRATFSLPEDDVTKSESESEGRLFLRASLERSAEEEEQSAAESSPEDAPPKKKTTAIPLSPICSAPALDLKHRSWTPERKEEEARAEADALADMLRAASIK